MSNTLENLTQKLHSKEDLSSNEAFASANILTSVDIPSSDKQNFLRALGEKGETGAEVSAFAEAFRKMCLKPDFGNIPSCAIDVVGTGGDHSGSYNISTTAGFLIAASGVPVIKHGNRSVTSKCGSADILEGLGFKISADPALLKRSLEEINFVFLFAPDYHPAFKAIAPVRKALAAEGKRTIFNILGPLINPASPAFQLLGTFSHEWISRMATALNTLGLQRALVVHCEVEKGKGMDELSTTGMNHACSAGDVGEKWIQINLNELGLVASPFSDLSGGDVNDNLGLLNKILAFDAPRGLTDSVLLNAGAGLWVAKQASDIKQGIEIARETLESGKLSSWLQRVKKIYNV